MPRPSSSSSNNKQREQQQHETFNMQERVEFWRGSCKVFSESLVPRDSWVHDNKHLIWVATTLCSFRVCM